MSGASAGNLSAYGWTDRVAALAAEHPGATVGRVARVDRGMATVVTVDGTVRVDIREVVATGDWVVIDPVADAVSAVLPRWAALVRRAPDRDEPQLLAANVDVVLIAVGCDRPVNLRRIERLLAVAWESGARPVVVLTKSDAAEDPDALVAEVEGVALGVDVLVTSAHRDLGLDLLRDQVGPGETAVLIGESGAGKSTLVNALVGREQQAVGDVREGDRKGRHTTTVRELVPLGDGAVLLDTPGLRAVGLWGGDEGLDRTFPDVAELAEGCRFRDCAHDAEPDCAVQLAVEEGRLDADRVEAYRHLAAELEHVRRQADIRLRRESERAFGRMSRAAMQAKQDRRDGLR